MKVLIPFSFILLIIASSCGTQKTTFNYLQHTSDTTITDSLAYKPPVIRKGDMLSIKVYSLANGVDPRIDAPFNIPESNTPGSATISTSGVVVDENGNIEYPQIGLVHAEGLTREELQEEIRKKLETQLNQPSVIVRFINFRVTVLGEVRSPGTFTAPTERINILEALGLAGDITEFGLKTTVKVIRENNGQREIGMLDLTSEDMFSSPYFRLQQNDIVLVEQSRRKIKQLERQEVAQQVGIASSIITAIALILNLIR